MTVGQLCPKHLRLPPQNCCKQGCAIVDVQTADTDPGHTASPTRSDELPPGHHGGHVSDQASTHSFHHASQCSGTYDGCNPMIDQQNAESSVGSCSVASSVDSHSVDKDMPDRQALEGVDSA